MSVPEVRGRVSIVTACYNDGAWLPETAASVRRQSYRDIEHIVVDDGSSDPATLATLDELAASGVRIVRVKHGGLARARNAGIAVATGEFLLALDRDDLIHRTYCATAVRALRAHPDAAIAVPDTRVFGDAHHLIRPLRLDLGGALRDPTMFPAMLVRRAAVIEAGCYDEDVAYAEDDELWFRVMALYPERVFLGETLFYYRRRPGQLTARHDERALPARVQLFRKNAELFAANAGGFLGRVRAERAVLDQFERRFGRLERVLGRWRRP